MSQLVQMFDGQFNRKIIEKMYIKSNKDYMITLDDLLNNKIPQNIETYQMIIKDAKEEGKET